MPFSAFQGFVKKTGVYFKNTFLTGFFFTLNTPSIPLFHINFLAYKALPDFRLLMISQ